MRRLAVFAKFWEPGQVKTRLGQVIGARQASRFHRQCLLVILNRLSKVADERTLVYTPAQLRTAFKQVLPQGWELEPQGAGDLGARLRHFVQRSVVTGADRLILLGADSPWVSAELLQDAFARLEGVPVVVGPSQDGGYYLLGIRQPYPELFEAIDWGTSRVWWQTLARLRLNQTAFELLPLGLDIDTYPDLLQLNGQLDQLFPGDPRPLETARLCHLVRALVRRYGEAAGGSFIS